MKIKDAAHAARILRAVIQFGEGDEGLYCGAVVGATKQMLSELKIYMEHGTHGEVCVAFNMVSGFAYVVAPKMKDAGMKVPE